MEMMKSCELKLLLVGSEDSLVIDCCNLKLIRGEKEKRDFRSVLIVLGVRC